VAPPIVEKLCAGIGKLVEALFAVATPLGAVATDPMATGFIGYEFHWLRIGDMEQGGSDRRDARYR
jgi:hypothetical protein